MLLMHPKPKAARRPARAGGFSLIEVAIATALLAVGVTSLMIATRSSTQVNAGARQLTQATYLVQEVREWTLKLPFRDPDPGDQDDPPGPDGSSPQVFVDDLDDLMNVTYCPPRDANGAPISGLAGWSQRIALSWRDVDSLTTAVSAGSSDVIRVTVTVAHNGRDVLAGGWLVTRRPTE